MDDGLIDTLPLAQRLALSYARGEKRRRFLALFALDARLKSVVRAGGEPVIAQMKLAWWRDRFASDPGEWPFGEPLLALLRNTVSAPASLGPLVDGWEALLAESFTTAEGEDFAAGQQALWSVADPAAARMGRQWGLANLALNLSDPQEIAIAEDLLAREGWNGAPLERSSRPLQVLHALAGRAMKTGATDLLDGPAAMMLAMRVGITGR